LAASSGSFNRTGWRGSCSASPLLIHLTISIWALQLQLNQYRRIRVSLPHGRVWSFTGERFFFYLGHSCIPFFSF
jgi:hypothetical protein